MSQSNIEYIWIKCSGVNKDPRHENFFNKSCDKNLLRIGKKHGQLDLEVKCPRCKTINQIHLNEQGE
jgi:phage FluMu protein Com